MNCAESQDLLLDLAYGELEPARAAQVEEHVAGCPACRAERSHLEEARKLSSVLRELEEPSANFDEPILRAARAEAGMQADGTPGRVVEVAASVKPLGLQATRLDPHAKVQGGSRRESWWRRRAGILGSVAAAAVVAAVVVSVSLSGSRGRVAPVEVEPITVRAPGAVVPDSMKDALARNDKRESPAAPPAAVPTAAPETKADRAAAPDRKAAPAQAPERKAAPAEDAPAPKAVAKLAQRDKQAAPAKARATTGAEASEGRTTQIASEDRGVASNRALAAAEEIRAHPRSTDETTAAPGSAGAVASPAQATGYAAQYAPPPPAAKQAQQAQIRNADALESDASAARRAGEYPRAAALYREAAALRKDSAPQQAAWDMAHAVECLAAGGNVAEAIVVRRELLRSFPDQQGPRAAANSALRSVPLPSGEDVPAGK